MSAMRTRLLAAAALCGVLAPTATCWAQAYGAKAVVDHNDLRWFEPVELDLDGQMPRRDKGFFFSADKLYWATLSPSVEIGSPGLVVDSEQIVQAPSNAVAFTALMQVEDFDFTNTLDEVFAFSGLDFVVANTQGTDSLSDDTETPFVPVGPAPTTVTEFIEDVNTFNADPANIANNLTVRVGGVPAPVPVRNGILDGVPDAGFAGGERYEFGYSDGERGWRATVLDGPGAIVENVYGVGNGNFGDNLGQDGGLVDLALGLGFGSVAVNFDLPSPDFLVGFRDYVDNGEGITGGVTSGPLLFIRNLNQLGVDGDNVGIAPPTPGGGTFALNATVPLQIADSFNTQQMLADPFEASLTAGLVSLFTELDELDALLQVDADDDGAALFLAGIAAVQAARTSALQLQSDLNAALAIDGMVDPNEFDTQVADLIGQLNLLDTAVMGLFVTLATDGDGVTAPIIAQRLADDINGNGNGGEIVVLADVDGDGIDDDVVARIVDVNDLFRFNVFFDEVTVRNRTEINGVELMRTHELSTRHKLQQGRWDAVQFAWGVSFTDLQDEFFFGGVGGILDGTSVSTEIENQIVGPQIGLKWIRRDGPWDFVIEGRGTLGYNIVDLDQTSIVASTTVPGALNRPINLRPTASNDGRRYDEFSPLGELRAQLRYRLAKSVTLQAGYTARYFSNIHRGANATQFALPNFGINDVTENVFTNGLNVGVEFRH